VARARATRETRDFAPHVRCWCRECEFLYGDQADPEFDELVELRARQKRVTWA